MKAKEKTKDIIGKTEGFYPKINHLKNIADNNITGTAKTLSKALKFWQNILDINVLQADPFFESHETTLLLHQQVLKLTIADFIFNKFKQVEFTEDELLQAASKAFFDSSKNAIQRDIKAILRMYSENIPENIFFDLHLLLFDGKNYRKEI